MSDLGSRAFCFIPLPHPRSSALEFGMVSALVLHVGLTQCCPLAVGAFAISLVKTVLVSGSKIASWKEVLWAILLSQANNQGSSFKRCIGFLL